MARPQISHDELDWRLLLKAAVGAEMQFYAKGGIDALDRVSTRKR